MTLPDDVRSLFEGANFVHLATLLPGGAPVSIPIWAGVEAGRIVFFTQPQSRKARHLEVNLGADQEQHRLRVHEDGHALVFDDLVERRGGFGILEHVLLPGAAAVLHADAQTHVGLLALGHDLLHARGGAVGEGHHLRAQATGAGLNDSVHGFRYRLRTC